MALADTLETLRAEAAPLLEQAGYINHGTATRSLQPFNRGNFNQRVGQALPLIIQIRDEVWADWDAAWDGEWDPDAFKAALSLTAQLIEEHYAEDPDARRAFKQLLVVIELLMCRLAAGGL